MLGTRTARRLALQCERALDHDAISGFDPGQQLDVGTVAGTQHHRLRFELPFSRWYEDDVLTIQLLHGGTWHKHAQVATGPRRPVRKIEARVRGRAWTQFAISIGHLHTNVDGPRLWRDHRCDVVNATQYGPLREAANRDSHRLSAANRRRTGFRDADRQPQRTEIGDREQYAVWPDGRIHSRGALDDRPRERTRHGDDGFCAGGIAKPESHDVKPRLGGAHRRLCVGQRGLGLDYLALGRHSSLEQVSFAGKGAAREVLRSSRAVERRSCLDRLWTPDGGERLACFHGSAQRHQYTRDPSGDPGTDASDAIRIRLQFGGSQQHVFGGYRPDGLNADVGAAHRLG